MWDLSFLAIPRYAVRGSFRMLQRVQEPDDDANPRSSAAEETPGAGQPAGWAAGGRIIISTRIKIIIILLLNLTFVLSLQWCSRSSTSVHLCIRPLKAAETEAAGAPGEPSAQGPAEGAAEPGQHRYDGASQSHIPRGCLGGSHGDVGRPHAGPRLLQRRRHSLFRQQPASGSAP